MKESQRLGALSIEFARTQIRPGNPKQGLYGWLIRSLGANNEAHTVKALSRRIGNHFKEPPVHTYDVTLDTYMTDWDIKEYMAKHMGINSWDDLSEEETALQGSSPQVIATLGLCFPRELLNFRNGDVSDFGVGVIWFCLRFNVLTILLVTYPIFFYN